MQTIELLKQARDAIIGYRAVVYGGNYISVNDIVQGLEQHIKELESAEPVAWMNMERNTITWDKLYPEMIPLYLHPDTDAWKAGYKHGAWSTQKPEKATHQDERVQESGESEHEE